jgi:hypothetical protein
MTAFGRVLVPIAVAAVATAGIVERATSASTKPALQFVRIDPLIVRGLGFRGEERVTVTARVPYSNRTAHVTATTDGTFRVRLGRVRSYDRCAFTLFVRARGSLGSEASIRTLPRMCAVRQP